MLTSTHLLRRRRFLPLFVTQLFNAFNDNLYKTTMVLFVVYAVYSDPATEASFSALASGLFILPFFILSALAGQLADMRDKAKIIRTVKLCEIGLMIIGACGLYMAWKGIMVHTVAIPLLLLALFLTGVQSTFLGPIKYAILPQHLKKDEVLAGTGLVEAGTYIAILVGTILAGPIAVDYTGWAAIGIIVVSCIGYLVSRQVPPAPPLGEVEKLDWHILRASVKLVRDTMHNREIWFAIIAISFFWTIGAVLFIIFPPLAKNQLLASKEVASLFLVIFSVGIALGSVSINALLKGKVSARYAPVCVVIMGGFLVAFYLVAKAWIPNESGQLLPVETWILEPLAIPLSLTLLGIATMGGMFVVPLYAFLTTRCAHDAASRTIAANNIVNSLSMVIGSVLGIGLTSVGIPAVDQLLLAGAMTVISAWLGWKLHQAEKHAAASAEPAPAQ